MATRCLTHPRLLARLARAAWHFRRRDWYRRPPFLPLPSEHYIRWRLHTAFGDEEAMPSITDLEKYLGWTEWMGKHRRKGS